MEVLIQGCTRPSYRYPLDLPLGEYLLLSESGIPRSGTSVVERTGGTRDILILAKYSSSISPMSLGSLATSYLVSVLSPSSGPGLTPNDAALPILGCDSEYLPSNVRDVPFMGATSVDRR